MKRLAPLTLGMAALLALLGLFRFLPPQAAFFLSALTIVLFPGMMVTRLVPGDSFDRQSPPEHLVIWFVMGTGVLSALGLVGLLLKVTVGSLIIVCIAGFAVVMILIIAKGAATRGVPGNKPEGASPTALSSEVTSPVKLRHVEVGPVGIILLIAAVGLALITLLTPRDYDDWYYLAYIKDYAAGMPLASGDAIFDMGKPVAPRIWFGGGWWVLEAMLAQVSGVDAVTCHQVYLPLLILPFAVMAVYTLARRLFHSAWTALLACGFQMLFYLSSAFPYKSTGWMVFARIAQDKVVACFVVVPVAAALALRFFKQADRDDGTRQRGLIYLYWVAVFTSVLVHGMGPVWLSLFVVPFTVVELLRHRTRESIRTLGKVTLPILVCAAVLLAARGLVTLVVTAPPQEVIPAPGVLSGVYLPGMPFHLGTDTTNPLTWVLREGSHILNPLFILRYPLAIAGLVLTFALLVYFRSSIAARFLISATAATLFLLFTPTGVALSTLFLTPRLVFRLVWILPWGLTAAFFLERLRPRPVVAFLLLAAVTLALARGNPANYGALFSKMHGRNRPSPDAAAAFGFLASRPSPQGVVLASEATGRMIPAFLPDAYPVNFREYGPVSREQLARIVGLEHVSRELLDLLEASRVRYILIENSAPLDQALEEHDRSFRLEYRNRSYSLWSIVSLDSLPGGR